MGGAAFSERASLSRVRAGTRQSCPKTTPRKTPTLLSTAPIKRPKLWQPAETLACVMRRSSDAAMRGGDFPVPLHPASSTARERRHATSQISAPAAAQPHSIVGEGRDPLPGTALTGKFVARIVFPAKEDVGRELFPAHSRSFVSLRRFYGEGIFLCPGKAALFRCLSAANARRQAFMPAAAILFGIPREDLTATDKKRAFPGRSFSPSRPEPAGKQVPPKRAFRHRRPGGSRRTRRNAQRDTARVGREEKLHDAATSELLRAESGKESRIRQTDNDQAAPSQTDKLFRNGVKISDSVLYRYLTTARSADIITLPSRAERGLCRVPSQVWPIVVGPPTGGGTCPRLLGRFLCALHSLVFLMPAASAGQRPEVCPQHGKAYPLQTSLVFRARRS